MLISIRIIFLKKIILKLIKLCEIYFDFFIYLKGENFVTKELTNVEEIEGVRILDKR